MCITREPPGAELSRASSRVLLAETRDFSVVPLTSASLVSQEQGLHFAVDLLVA